MDKIKSWFKSWSTMAEEERGRVMRDLRTLNRPVNVLVLGLPGAGKSSFISSLQSCLTGDHGREVGVAGKVIMGDSFTFRLLRYPFSGDELCNNEDIKAPVMYDMPGLPNADDERLHAILSCVMEGYVPIDEPILVAAGMDKTAVEEMYCEHADSARHRIDRVFFVHSTQVEIPDNLIRIVTAVCRQSGVTMFSILSHADKTSGILCGEQQFELALGTCGTPRGCKVELYHKVQGNYGRYYDKPETNYYLLLMWRALLNSTYRIKSQQA